MKNHTRRIFLLLVKMGTVVYFSWTQLYSCAYKRCSGLSSMSICWRQAIPKYQLLPFCNFYDTYSNWRCCSGKTSPSVKIIMKGIFNRRPPQPKHAFAWDVGGVLEHILSVGENVNLSLKKLSHKLVVTILLAPSNASRASEIHTLDFVIWAEMRMVLRSPLLNWPKKLSHGGKKKVVHCPSLKQDRSLCPIVNLEE